jgi:hypothetical protein
MKGGGGGFAEFDWVQAQDLGTVSMSCLVFLVPSMGSVPRDIACYLTIRDVPSVGWVIALARG